MRCSSQERDVISGVRQMVLDCAGCARFGCTAFAMSLSIRSARTLASWAIATEANIARTATTTRAMGFTVRNPRFRHRGAFGTGRLHPGPSRCSSH